MSNASVPPRFVPTLTEVFQPAPPPVLTPGEAAMPMTLSPGQQDEMVKRVLQRIDMTLERRLREAVGQLILEHTETLAPRLREEIERVVRQSVNQAFEHEATQLPVRS
jgi:hypothetical protein